MQLQLNKDQFHSHKHFLEFCLVPQSFPLNDLFLSNVLLQGHQGNIVKNYHLHMQGPLISSLVQCVTSQQEWKPYIFP